MELFHEAQYPDNSFRPTAYREIRDKLSGAVLARYPVPNMLNRLKHRVKYLIVFVVATFLFLVGVAFFVQWYVSAMMIPVCADCMGPECQVRFLSLFIYLLLFFILFLYSFYYFTLFVLLYLNAYAKNCRLTDTLLKLFLQITWNNYFIHIFFFKGFLGCFNSSRPIIFTDRWFYILFQGEAFPLILKRFNSVNV